MMMTQSDVDAPCWRAGLYHLPTRNDQPEEVCERQPGRSEYLETCASWRVQTDTRYCTTWCLCSGAPLYDQRIFHGGLFLFDHTPYVLYCTIAAKFRCFPIFLCTTMYYYVCTIEPYPNESIYEACQIAALTYSYVLGSNSLYTPTRNSRHGRTFRSDGKASCSRQPSRQRAILSTVSVPSQPSHVPTGFNEAEKGTAQISVLGLPSM
jgi:hypothetical protein